jgi:hypothetical protein
VFSWYPTCSLPSVCVLTEETSAEVADKDAQESDADVAKRDVIEVRSASFTYLLVR